MGVKLAWSGLAFMLAVPAFLRTMGNQPNSDVIVAVGGVLMVIGVVLMWLNK
jgi:Flp pilus assembly protein TadB